MALVSWATARVGVHCHFPTPSIFRCFYFPVGVQCPITSSLGEFLGYWEWLWYPGLPPVLVSIAISLRLPYFGVFTFTLRLPLDFIRVFSSRPTYMYLHPFGRPFTYSPF